MGMEKAIESGKEHRRPYRGSKAFDHTCRNHGSCAWCSASRQLNKKKLKEKSEDMLRDFNEKS